MGEKLVHRTRDIYYISSLSQIERTNEANLDTQNHLTFQQYFRGASVK